MKLLKLGKANSIVHAKAIRHALRDTPTTNLGKQPYPAKLRIRVAARNLTAFHLFCSLLLSTAP